MLFHVELVLSGPLAPNKINLEGMWNKIFKEIKSRFFFKILCINRLTKQFTQKFSPLIGSWHMFQLSDLK